MVNTKQQGNVSAEPNDEQDTRIEREINPKYPRTTAYASKRRDQEVFISQRLSLRAQNLPTSGTNQEIATGLLSPHGRSITVERRRRLLPEPTSENLGTDLYVGLPREPRYGSIRRATRRTPVQISRSGYLEELPASVLLKKPTAET